MQEYIEIPTNNGTLRGFIHKPMKDKYPICIIFHGFTGSNIGTKFCYVRLSRLLEQVGIATIRMDFLGSGESDLEFKDMTFKQEFDSACTIVEKMIENNHISDIYLLGHSMGGVIASEISKKYPSAIKKMCLWAPALSLPDSMNYLVGNVSKAKYYDHNGFKISNEFVEDIISRDFYQGLDIYKNELMIIHGNKDTTVPYSISSKYLKLYNNPIFITIEDGNHNFDKVKDIEKVIDLTYNFFRK